MSLLDTETINHNTLSSNTEGNKNKSHFFRDTANTFKKTFNQLNEARDVIGDKLRSIRINKDKEPSLMSYNQQLVPYKEVVKERQEEKLNAIRQRLRLEFSPTADNLTIEPGTKGLINYINQDNQKTSIFLEGNEFITEDEDNIYIRNNEESPESIMIPKHYSRQEILKDNYTEQQLKTIRETNERYRTMTDKEWEKQITEVQTNNYALNNLLTKNMSTLAKGIDSNFRKEIDNMEPMGIEEFVYLTALMKQQQPTLEKALDKINIGESITEEELEALQNAQYIHYAEQRRGISIGAEIFTGAPQMIKDNLMGTLVQSLTDVAIGTALGGLGSAVVGTRVAKNLSKVYKTFNDGLKTHKYLNYGVNALKYVDLGLGGRLASTALEGYVDTLSRTYIFDALADSNVPIASKAARSLTNNTKEERITDKRNSRMLQFSDKGAIFINKLSQQEENFIKYQDKIESFNENWSERVIDGLTEEIVSWIPFIPDNVKNSLLGKVVGKTSKAFTKVNDIVKVPGTTFSGLLNENLEEVFGMAMNHLMKANDPDTTLSETIKEYFDPHNLAITNINMMISGGLVKTVSNVFTKNPNGQETSSINRRLVENYYKKEFEKNPDLILNHNSRENDGITKDNYLKVIDNLSETKIDNIAQSIFEKEDQQSKERYSNHLKELTDKITTTIGNREEAINLVKIYDAVYANSAINYGVSRYDVAKKMNLNFQTLEDNNNNKDNSDNTYQQNKNVDGDTIDLTEEFSFIKANSPVEVANRIEKYLNGLIGQQIATATEPFKVKVVDNKLVLVDNRLRKMNMLDHLKNSPVALTGQNKIRHDTGLLALERILNGSVLDSGRDKKVNTQKKNSRLVKEFKNTLEQFRYFKGTVKFKHNNQDYYYRVNIDTTVDKGTKDKNVSDLYNIKLVPDPAKSEDSTTSGSAGTSIGDNYSKNNDNVNSSPKGQSEFRGSEVLIKLYRNRADASTLLHESAHYFLELIKSFAKDDYAVAKEQLQEIDDWTTSQLTNNPTLFAHERFARGFEQYIRSGNYSKKNKLMTSVFDYFKGFLENIYRNAQDLEIDVNNKQMYEFFDKYLHHPENYEAKDFIYGDDEDKNKKDNRDDKEDNSLSGLILNQSLETDEKLKKAIDKRIEELTEKYGNLSTPLETIAEQKEELQTTGEQIDLLIKSIDNLTKENGETKTITLQEVEKEFFRLNEELQINRRNTMTEEDIMNSHEDVITSKRQNLFEQLFNLVEKLYQTTEKEKTNYSNSILRSINAQRRETLEQAEVMNITDEKFIKSLQPLKNVNEMLKDYEENKDNKDRIEKGEQLTPQQYEKITKNQSTILTNLLREVKNSVDKQQRMMEVVEKNKMEEIELRKNSQRQIEELKKTIEASEQLKNRFTDTVGITAENLETILKESNLLKDSATLNKILKMAKRHNGNIDYLKSKILEKIKLDNKKQIQYAINNVLKNAFHMSVRTGKVYGNLIYEDTSLAQDLKRINKLSMKKASQELLQLEQKRKDGSSEDSEIHHELKKQLLYFKATPAVDLELSPMLEILNGLGRYLQQSEKMQEELKQQKLYNHLQEQRETLGLINDNKLGRGKFNLGSSIIGHLGNLPTLLEYVGGRKLAEKFDFVQPETIYRVGVKEKTDKIFDDIFKNVKNNPLYNDNAKNLFEYYNENIAEVTVTKKNDEGEDSYMDVRLREPLEKLVDDLRTELEALPSKDTGYVHDEEELKTNPYGDRTFADELAKYQSSVANSEEEDRRLREKFEELDRTTAEDFQKQAREEAAQIREEIAAQQPEPAILDLILDDQEKTDEALELERETQEAFEEAEEKETAPEPSRRLRLLGMLAGLDKQMTKNSRQHNYQYRLSKVVYNILKEIVETTDYKNKDVLTEAVEKSYSPIEPYVINRWNLMYFYLQKKNKETDKLLQRYYGENYEELNELLKEQDATFFNIAETLYNSVQDRDELAPYYRIDFNRDMGQVDGYFPRVSFHEDNINTFDMLTTEEKRMQKVTAIEQRSKNSIPNLANNPLLLAMKHIRQTEYTKSIAVSLKNMIQIFSSKSIKDRIIDKKGQDVYNALMAHLDGLKYNYQKADSEINNLIGYGLGNWAKSVTNTPSVFLKQMTSFLPYSEGLDLSTYLLQYADAWRNSSKVYDYMFEKSPYLNARLNGGEYGDLLNTLRKESDSFLLEKWKKTNGWISDRIAKLLPESIRGHTLTELGDMVSVIYGGYARIQTQIKNGMTEEEALKDFEKQTVETQQSDYSSLQPRSRLENGLLSRSFGMFKSQDAQYFQRTMQDLMRYFSGEATEENIRNNTIMYHLLLPALMTAVTGVIGDLYGKRDKDWWEYAKDYSTAVLLSFLPMGLLQQSVALEITMNFDNLKNAITSLFNLEGVITGLPLQTYYNMFFKRKNKEEDKKKKK